jgi:D-cysteine desulfhydrase family pyridoxal phosphate-dependent enzyme
MPDAASWPPARVLEALDRHPRISLGACPTPLVPLERLSRELGRQVLLKRDDTLGPAGGGNKTRKLEYLLADALARGETRVVTVGGVQSNHARLTAAAARMLGLEPHLLLIGSPPDEATGNLRLMQLLGATLHFIPPGPMQGRRCGFDELDDHVRRLATERVGRHYHVPMGGSTGLGALGYVRAALELAAQAREADIPEAWVVLAAGTGGTLGGLLAGLRLVGSELRPLGIDIGSFWGDFPALVHRIADDACRLLGAELDLEPEDVPLVEGQYVGHGYGTPSPEGQEAARRLARGAGVLLDPTYTAKAFAALLDLHANGHLGSDGPLIFWHTGGLPGLFAG